MPRSVILSILLFSFLHQLTALPLGGVENRTLPYTKRDILDKFITESILDNKPPKSAPPKSAPPKNVQPKSAPPKNVQPKSTQPMNAQPKNAQPKNGQPVNAQPKNSQPNNVQPKTTELNPSKSNQNKPPVNEDKGLHIDPCRFFPARCFRSGTQPGGGGNGSGGSGPPREHGHGIQLADSGAQPNLRIPVRRDNYATSVSVPESVGGRVAYNLLNTRVTANADGSMRVAVTNSLTVGTSVNVWVAFTNSPGVHIPPLAVSIRSGDTQNIDIPANTVMSNSFPGNPSRSTFSLNWRKIPNLN